MSNHLFFCEYETYLDVLVYQLDLGNLSHQENLVGLGFQDYLECKSNLEKAFNQFISYQQFLARLVRP
jgi:hypothetical protein